MRHRLTIHYTLHQIAYWAASAGILSFATTFLLAKGFPASQVGLLMACASILSCVTQPALAARADRSKRCVLGPMITVLTGVSVLAFALLLVKGLPSGAFALLYLVGVWAFDAMMPLLNAVCVYYDEQGTPINYGVARGLGSLSYSLAALGLGQVIEKLGPNWMVYMVLLLLPVCVLITLSYPNMGKARQVVAADMDRGNVCTVAEFFVRYRWYCRSLVGVLLLAMFHAMTENYLIAIMERLGGDSRHVGVALFIATAVEAGILLFLNQIRARISDNWLFRIAAFSFLLKSAIFLVAPSIPVIYAAQLLQMTSYSFLAPIQIYYASAKVHPIDMVKGQAFITASYTLGCAMGNLTGGFLLESFGVEVILSAGVAIAAVGTLVLLLTVERKDAAVLIEN